MALVGLAACGGSSSKVDDLSTKTDAAADQAVAGDMAFFSVCGHPGDVGNSKGVGKFCGNGEADCATQTFANVCSSLGNSTADPTQNSFFCTSPACTATSPADFCGENASCVCTTKGCGCIPAACAPADLGT